MLEEFLNRVNGLFAVDCIRPRLLEVIVGQFFERLLVVLVPYFKDSWLSSGLFGEEKVTRLMVGWNTG